MVEGYASCEVPAPCGFTAKAAAKAKKDKLKAFGDMIIDQFDVLYNEGATNARCMPICLHTFFVGQPNKFKHLARAFEYIASHKDVWLTTGDEMNDWHRKQYM